MPCAPLAGVVTERQATPGSEVRPDSDNPLFVVSDPRHLWAYAELPEKDLAKVHPGQPMAVMVDAYPDQRFQAVVESAVGDVDAQSRRVPVRCAVPNPDRKLKPEMFARLMPVEEGRHLPRVPNAALGHHGPAHLHFCGTPTRGPATAGKSSWPTGAMRPVMWKKG